MRVRLIRTLAVATGVLLAVALTLALFGGRLAAFALTRVLGAAGYDVRAQTVAIGLRRAVLTGVQVRTNAGEPVFEGDRVEAQYSLRDLLPGGRRRFGLVALDLERPHVTLIHRSDGSFNIPIPSSPQGPQAAAAPLDLTLVVHDGSAVLEDRTRQFADARHFAIAALHANLALHPQVPSHYDVGFDLIEGGGRYPIRGRATLDDRRGYEIQRWTAPRLALAPLLDYGINSNALHATGGELRGIVVALVALPGVQGGFVQHLDGQATLEQGTFYLGALAKPVRAARGPLYVYDNGLALPHVDARLGRTPLRLAGAIYNFSAPTLRLGAVADGELADLKTMSAGAAKLPVRGTVHARLLIEGPATQPLVLATVRSPRVDYAQLRLDRPQLSLALEGKEIDVLSSHAQYAGIAARGRGSILLEKRITANLAVAFDAPPNALPVEQRIIPGVPLSGDGVVAGVAPALAVYASVRGASRTQRVSGAIALDGNGVGDVGPLSIEGPGGASLFVRAALDRPHKAATAIVALQHFRLLPGSDALLPGITLPPLPAVDGAFDSHAVVAVDDRRVAVAGDAGVQGFNVAGFPITTARVRANGDLAHLQVLALSASGPWGTIAGRGGVNGKRGAFAGRYRGSLAALGHLMGRNDLSGSADVPVRLLSNGSTMLAQIDRARFAGARVAGLPFESLDGTVRVRGRAYDVYAADAGVAGAQVIARGSFGDGGRVAVSSSDVALANLPAAGPHFSGGRMSLAGDIGGTLSAPLASAGVVVTGGRFGSQQFGGTSGFAFAGERLTIRDASLSVDGAVVALGGDVGGVRPGAPIVPRYKLAVHVRAAPIDTLLAAAHNATVADGSLDADLRVAGSGAAPQVSGSVVVPEGSVNGLHYRNASLALHGTPQSLVARAGRATVGDTALNFSGDVAAHAQSMTLHAPYARLADFDDLFDPGDMLAGQGHVDANLNLSPNTVGTNGDVALTGARYGRYPLGLVRAHWSTAGRRVNAGLHVAGRIGALAAQGNVVLPSSAPLRDTLHRADLDMNARMSGIDIAAWLPAAGITAPVTGKLDGAVNVRGRYPALVAVARTELKDGRIATLPVERFTVDGEARGTRATISSLVLETPSLSLTGSGAFGLRPGAAIAAQIHASSPDLAMLAGNLTQKKIHMTGSAGATVVLAGTMRRPAVTADLSVDALLYHGLHIPHADAHVAVSEREAELRSANVNFVKGSLFAAGRIPFDLLRPHLDANAPLTAHVDMREVDASNFTGLLPDGTTLGGHVDGTLSLAGTALAPRFTGTLALAGGSYNGPQLASPIRDVVAHVSLANKTVMLDSLHMNAGAGTIDASGAVTVADLRNPAHSAAVRAKAVANNATFDVPKLVRATVNGNVTVDRIAGAPYRIGGAVSVPQGRIDPNAFIPRGSSNEAKPPSLPLAFDLGVDLGRDVRAQSGQVDVGATGSLRVGGTLATPTLKGEIDATDGTVSFYRTFALQSAALTFSPDDGVIPLVNAVATTHVPDPSTNVTLTVAGLATQMNVALASDPTYDRGQILGLLVGAQNLGAVSGVASSSGGAPSVGGIAQSVAYGALNEQLTRSLFEPLSQTLGGALGLQRLAINYNPSGGFGASARHGLAKNVDAVFSQEFGYPQRQSFGIEARPSPVTSFNLSIFQQQGLGQLQPITTVGTNALLTPAQSSTSASGFSFVFKRLFK